MRNVVFLWIKQDIDIGDFKLSGFWRFVIIMEDYDL